MNSIQNFITDVSSPFSVDNSHFDEKEIAKKAAPAKPVYTVETKSKAARIAIDIILGILSVVFLPYGLYRLVHLLAGKIIVPAQWIPQVNDLDRGALAKRVKKLSESEPKHNPVIAKRISVLVDGKMIDAMMLGRKNNLNNKRWTLFSNGNGMCFEQILSDSEKIGQIDKIGTNLLLYNYQGVQGSQGWATRDGMVSAHQSMLKFLEDEEKGIGAKEIIQWGISIGGGVQGHAMKTHKLKEGVKYVCAKEQTFSHISNVPGPLLGALMKFFGWELSSIGSSKKLEEKKLPEIVIQTATANAHLTKDKIKDDGVISKDSAHAYRLLSLKDKWKHKKFIGTSAMHCGFLGKVTTDKINNAIKKALSVDYQGFHAAAAA